MKDTSYLCSRSNKNKKLLEDVQKAVEYNVKL